MERAWRDLIRVLLGRLREEGLLSQSTYLGAVDLVCSAVDIPGLPRCPACLAEEASAFEHSQDPR